MSERTIRGRAAIVGVGESTYYRHGQSPDPAFVLVAKAVLAACADAGLDPRQLDGFVSYSDDGTTPMRLAAALGCDELRWATMQWGGGGGGCFGAVQQAAGAIAAGFADHVVVYRGLTMDDAERYGQLRPANVRPDDPFLLPYGVLAPVHWLARRAMRFFHDTGIDPSVQRAVAMASYHHAQQNPRALMRGRPLDEETYDESRWITEPFRLFDCCQENDAAAAIVLTSADRAPDLVETPAYVLSAAMGAPRRAGALVGNNPADAGADFKQVADRLWAMAGLGPADVDVVQSYENFTGAVVMSLFEHGFFTADDAAEVLRLENLLAPNGGLPLNTSGGNLAECYVHGLGLGVEAVRQVRGESCNQVPGARVALASGGPLSPPVTSMLLGTAETL
jgi:acetyl-CoA acetyltransferase